jgi:hypothetical protein
MLWPEEVAGEQQVPGMSLDLLRLGEADWR